MTIKAALPPGRVLGELDTTTYIELSAVVAVKDGKLSYYCAPEAWALSDVHDSISRQKRIRQLEQELAQLKAQGKKSKKPAATPPPAAALAPVAQAERPSCPHCQRVFPDRRGYDKHTATCAARPIEADTPPAAEPSAPLAPLAPAAETSVPLAYLYMDSTWTCSECHRDTFTQSTKIPNLCIQCAKAVRSGERELAEEAA